MQKINQVENIFTLLDEVTLRTKGCKTLEQAAQAAVDVIYEEFAASIVLVRLFATVPYKKLPEINQGKVAALASRRGFAHLLGDDSLILTLLGTRGVEPAWNDRRRSKDHSGIPLVSSDFVAEIPMMVRLLKSIGFDMDWIDRQDAIEIKTMASLSGVFYVSDAKTAVDNAKRNIISAQDFVRDYDVKTVFGSAASYIAKQSFVTLISFCRVSMEKSQVERFLPLISCFKASTIRLVMNDAFFT